MKLLFSESEHRYFFPEIPDMVLTSVSTLIGKYHEKFDVEVMAEKTAKKRGVDAKLLKAEWAEENKKAIDRGHLYHLHKENELYKLNGKDKSKVFRHSEENGFKVAFDITQLKPGIYPELIVYLPEFGVVGTSDYVEIFDDNTFILEDYKTNKKLEFEGFPIFSKTSLKKVPKKMYDPIAHIDDCNGMHYTIQLSIYAFCLEQCGYKLRPGGLRLHHALFDENSNSVDSIPYPVNYLKTEVKSLLKHFKQYKSKS